MKTKFSLFISVLAVALFGMGCASSPSYSDGAFGKFGTWKKSGIGIGDSTGGGINIQFKDDLVLTSKAGSKCWGGLLSNFELNGDFEMEVDMALENWTHKFASAALCFPYEEKKQAWTKDSVVIWIVNDYEERYGVGPIKRFHGVEFFKDGRQVELRFNDTNANRTSWRINRRKGEVKVFVKEKGQWSLYYTYKSKLVKPFKLFFYLKNFDQYSNKSQDTPALQIRFSNLKIKKL